MKTNKAFKKWFRGRWIPDHARVNIDALEEEIRLARIDLNHKEWLLKAAREYFQDKRECMAIWDSIQRIKT